MKALVLSTVLFLSFLTSLQAEDYKNHSGEVTRTMIRGTRLYKVGGITVSRGGVKYVEKFVGQNVTMLCYIKNKKIIKIKSVEPKGAAKKNDSKMTVTKMRTLYRDNPSEAIAKYRNKTIKYSGGATTIRVKSPQEYIITFGNNTAELHISKVKLPADLNKKLWALREKRGAVLNLSFTGKWYANQGKILKFNQVTAIR